MNSPFKFDIGKDAPDFISVFDSATDMVGSTCNFLRGEKFEGVGTNVSSEFYSKLVNSLPDSWKQKLYGLGGQMGATPYTRIDELNAEQIDEWICEVYPERQYPAIAIGASNGALVHLYTALGIPWLPQTMLIPVGKKKKYPTDEPKRTMAWGVAPGEIFLKNNPEWQLHHMMDPNQDRLRVSTVGYFRIKKRSLGKWYTRFIRERLAPGGTLLVANCSLQWPVVNLDERHVFQFGGLGGATPEEYYYGSKKIRQFLRDQKARVRFWDSPPPDGDAPEAEWGLEPCLQEDIERLAKEEKYSVKTITFEHPQDPSPMVAELYRWWYSSQDRPINRLLVDSFAVQSPRLTQQKACIPYWLFFCVDPAAMKLDEYLTQARPYEEIYMMLLSHGKESLGSTPIDDWVSLMKNHAPKYDFIGTDASKYPIDLAVYSRYSRELQEKISDEFPLPATLTLKDFIAFERKWRKQPIDSRRVAIE